MSFADPPACRHCGKAMIFATRISMPRQIVYRCDHPEDGYTKVMLLAAWRKHLPIHGVEQDPQGRTDSGDIKPTTAYQADVACRGEGAVSRRIARLFHAGRLPWTPRWAERVGLAANGAGCIGAVNGALRIGIANVVPMLIVARNDFPANNLDEFVPFVLNSAARP